MRSRSSARSSGATLTIYNQREYAEVGGLISYGPSQIDAYRRAGVYVGRVLPEPDLGRCRQGHRFRTFQVCPRDAPPGPLLEYALSAALRAAMSGLGRREFITVLGGTAAAWPLAARARQPGRMRRVGVLLPASADDAAFQDRIGAFQAATPPVSFCSNTA